MALVPGLPPAARRGRGARAREGSGEAHAEGRGARTRAAVHPPVAARIGRAAADGCDALRQHERAARRCTTIARNRRPADIADKTLEGVAAGARGRPAAAVRPKSNTWMIAAGVAALCAGGGRRLGDVRPRTYARRTGDGGGHVTGAGRRVPAPAAAGLPQRHRCLPHRCLQSRYQVDPLASAPAASNPGAASSSKVARRMPPAPAPPAEDAIKPAPAPPRPAPGPLVAVSLSAPYPFEVMDGSRSISAAGDEPRIAAAAERQDAAARRARRVPRSARQGRTAGEDGRFEYSPPGARQDRHSGRARRLQDHGRQARSRVRPVPAGPGRRRRLPGEPRLSGRAEPGLPDHRDAGFHRARASSRNEQS